MDIRFNYIIFDLTELDKINQEEVVSFRYGNTKGIVKWLGDTPPSVQSLESKSEIYTHADILPEIQNEEWLVLTDNSNEIVSGSVI
jgi:hypothetical protein